MENLRSRGAPSSPTSSKQRGDRGTKEVNTECHRWLREGKTRKETKRAQTCTRPRNDEKTVATCVPSRVSVSLSWVSPPASLCELCLLLPAPPSPLLCISVFACLALFVLFLASLCSAAGRVCTARLWRYLLPCPPIGSSSAQHCRRSAFRTTGPPVSRLAIVLFWLHYPLQLGVRS